jgi:hypothetical protein
MIFIKGWPSERIYKPGNNSSIPDEFITQYHYIVDLQKLIS